MKAPPEVAEFYNNLIDAVASATGHKLDLTPETLPILDFYFQIYRESLSGKGKKEKAKGKGKKKAKARGNSKDIARLFAPMAGAYFGEVICRKYDCKWVASKKRYDKWRVQFKHCFLYFNPVAMAMEILSRKSVEDWPSTYFTYKEDEDVLSRALDQWDWITPDDYYSFIVRWEILDTIINMLATIEALKRQKDGTKLKAYKNADYGKHIRARVENEEKF